MTVHDSYKAMGTEPQTLAGATELAEPPAPRAFLVIPTGGGGARVVALPEGVDVTFGRSRGATITLDSEKVSRMHARVRRTGDVIEVEDLGSRNGTRVHGDEVTVGPILAVVGVTSGLRRTSTIADVVGGEARLTAEVDRSVRYHRPVTVAMIRIASDAILDQIERAIRPMDLIAEDAGDDYLVILPELGREEGAAAVQRLLDFARAANVPATAATALCPDDGTTVETLIGVLRAG